MCFRFKNKIICLILLLVFLLIPAAAQKSISNRQIQALASKRLERYPYAPKVLGFSVYSDRVGKYCRLDVHANRNRAKNHLIMAFATLAKIAPKTKQPYKQYIVSLHFNQHARLPEIWVSDARKTRECFIHQNIDLQTWLDRYLYQVQL